MTWHTFETVDGQEFGSFEAFYLGNDGSAYGRNHLTEEGTFAPSGWYWWPCFPGCLPDGEPIGPFETEREAIQDAQSMA